MIKITEKNNCCGCSACASICPKQCIKMVDDNEGFSYPLVDRVTCVDCGLCERVCNELHPYKEREPLKVLAAINRNEDIRLKSSSGGIFYILAEKIINEVELSLELVSMKTGRWLLTMPKTWKM